MMFDAMSATGSSGSEKTEITIAPTVRRARTNRIQRRSFMPEVSNCELYKLESKVEEIDAIIKRLKEQMKDWKEITFINGDPRKGMTLDDDQMDAIAQKLERTT